MAKILRFKTDFHDCAKISQTKDEKEKKVTSVLQKTILQKIQLTFSVYILFVETLGNISIYHYLEKYFLLKLWYDNDDDYQN